MFASTDQPTAFPPLLAETREYHAGVLFNRIYELVEDAPAASRRKALLQDGAGRAVRLLERRRSEARRLRYSITPDGPFAVFQWIPTYDSRDAITGHSRFTLARFETFEDAERFIECEYGERERCESHMEIEGPFRHVRHPLIDLATDGDDLPF